MSNELYDWMQTTPDQQQYALPTEAPVVFSEPPPKRIYMNMNGEGNSQTLPDVGPPMVSDGGVFSRGSEVLAKELATERQAKNKLKLEEVPYDPWLASPFSKGTKVGNKLFGEDDRYQMWPEKLVRSGSTTAGDVLSGEVPQWEVDPVTGAVHTGSQMIERAQDMSALAGTGGMGGTGEAAGVALGSAPLLRPALKFEGKIYKAPVGGQHLDALTPEMYTAFQKKAMAGDDINHYEFGFMNHKGQFLDRQKALDYAIKEGMVDEHAGKYGALTSTLLADSSKPGTAIEALAKTGKLKEVAHDPFTGDTAGKTYWDDLSKTKLSIPVEDMRSTHVPTEEGLLKRQLIKPEQLQGSIIIPAVGDRTMAGTRLTHINEKPLDYHVEMQGGPDYMRGISQMKDQSVWASDKGPITRMAKYARKLAKDNEGTDLNLVYSSMGARSGDYSHHMTDALLSQMKSAPVTKKAIKEFDTEMKDINPKWPGLSSPKLRDVLLENGKMRKQFVEEMALGEHQGKGFPDIGSTRAAITDPRFIGQPTGVTGYSMARLDPTGKIITDQKAPHITYRSKIAGKYLGGLDEHIPREIMFPDFYAGRRAASKKPLSDDRAFTMSNVHQVADQKWLDNLMKHIEATRQ